MVTFWPIAACRWSTVYLAEYVYWERIIKDSIYTTVLWQLRLSPCKGLNGQFYSSGTVCSIAKLRFSGVVAF